MPQTGKEIFKVRASEIDFNGKLTIPALADFLQETAWNHSLKMGLSVYDLQKVGLTWVLSRLKIEMTAFPEHQQLITIETWLSGIEKYFTYRNFRIYDEAMQVIGRATSTWLVLDFVKRQLTIPPDFIASRKANLVPETLPVASGKIPPLPRIDGEASFHVRWHDLDINRHVNNIYYFQWALEALPKEMLQNQKLVEIDILFKAETSYPGRVTSRCGKVSGKEWIHRIADEGGKELVQAKTIWADLE